MQADNRMAGLSIANDARNVRITGRRTKYFGRDWWKSCSRRAS
jgi:hypothetical protein